jgi:ESX secretion system ATPase EccB
MATRRDQLHSYQFMTQRVISALVMRETDPVRSPLRRGIGAMFGGLMVAVLIGAGSGVYGILAKSSSAAWRTDGSVVVERETGANFVFAGGRLNPTLNLASAKLAAGRPHPQVYRVSAESLGGVPRGVTIGIPGAPASLPDAGRQVGLPWTMCDVIGDPPRSVLQVGGPSPAGGASGDRGLVVQDASAGDRYLMWHGLKYHIQDSRSTLPALFGAVSPLKVSTAFLNAVPSGTDIVAVPVGNRGAASAKVAGRRNGDVLVARTAGGLQYYLVLDDGLAPITSLQETVLAARFPATPSPVTAASVTQLPVASALPSNDAATRPPDAPPALASINAGSTLCATTTDATQPPALRLGGSPASLAGAIPTSGAAPTGRPLADAVLMAPGRIAVVRVPGSGGYELITDLGIRYPVPTADALGLLGYATPAATAIPTDLVDLIPAGATLDPAAAIRPAPQG